MSDQPSVAQALGNTQDILRTTAADAAGSIWRLESAERDLDSNIIALPPHGEIQRHDGPSLDVLILVLDGSGTLETEADAVALTIGELVYLPRHSQRRIIAGAEGLRYLTVHQRKPGLSIGAAKP